MSLPYLNPYWNDLFRAENWNKLPDLSQIRSSAELAHFTPDELAKLDQAVAQLANTEDELRQFFCWMTEKISAGNGIYGKIDAEPVFLPDSKPPVCGDTFNLLLDLACIPAMIRMYKDRGWYDEIFHQALLDFRIWMEFAEQNHGTFGIRLGHAWICAQFEGIVLRLGRLQCNAPGKFFKEYKVYQNKLNGEYCTLLNTEMPFNAAGLYAQDGEAEAFRTASAEETAETVCGWAVGENARVKNEKVTLKKSEWELWLSENDTICNLHIPADGPLKAEDCRESMRRMYAFYQKHFRTAPKAFVCESWLLDPIFASILPETSNILTFQHLGTLLPFHGKSEMATRVFGTKAENEGLDAVPHKTSMQKTFAEYARNGGKFRNGGFFIPAELYA